MKKIETDRRTDKEIEKSTLELMDRVKEYYENLTPPCPLDNQPGTFVEPLVTPPPVTAAVYTCPAGDVYSWREGIGAKLLSSRKET